MQGLSGRSPFGFPLLGCYPNKFLFSVAKGSSIIISGNKIMTFGEYNNDRAPWDKKTPVEFKTRTYHGRVGTERTAGRGGVGQDWTPTEQFAQGTSLPRTLQSIENILPERLSRSTNKRNPM